MKTKMFKVCISGHRRNNVAWLPHAPEDPPEREVKKQIRIELEMIITSFRQADGVIRDEGVIFEIGCLQKALKLLDELHPSQRSRDRRHK